MPPAWYELDNVAEVLSPSLVVYPDRARENIRRLVKLAGDPARLRPHLKTTKLGEIVRMLAAEGVSRFKVATLAEAAMAARAGARDVLVGYQPVGPNVERLLTLQRAFPHTAFSALVDAETPGAELSAGAAASGTRVTILLDLDVGMHRTGVPPGPEAAGLYERLARLPGLRPGGLHAYDGHIRDREVSVRAARADEAFQPVAELRETLIRRGLPVPVVVAGGSPTFPMHAARDQVECSPGTLVFSDACTVQSFPDLDFLPAALVLSRVVSRPGGRRLCLDLGHKAVASENPHPRVSFLNLPDADAIGHSEEHLVVETSRARELPIGTCLFGLPWHICPTVALYDEAVVARDHHATERWRIARGRAVDV